MKRKLFLLLVFNYLCLSLIGQPPCVGTPETNAIVSASQTICAGTAASMSLANSYTNSGITFQWYASPLSAVGPFSPIAGATLSAYASPTLNTTMYYQLIVTCSGSGQNITLFYTVNVVSCAPPCSGTPVANPVVPASHSICLGDVASMSLATSYTDTGITYQWESSASSSGPFTAISGATTSAYTSGPLSSNMFYQVIVTCTNSGLSYIAGHSVAVNSCTYCAGTPANNTISPLTQTVCEGTSVNLALMNTYTASGITYQWQTSTVSPSGPFTSAATASLSTYGTPTTLTAGTYYFRVVITCTNSGQSFATTNTLTVVNCNNPCSGTPTSNTVLPNFHTLCPGDIATMTLANPYINTGISYQWGTSSLQTGPYSPIPNATLSTYTSPTLIATTYYNLTVTCINSGLTYTTSHKVTVVPCTYCSGTPDTNTILPLSHTVCEGSSANMSLANSYSVSDITYQWGSSAASLAGPFSAIPGATLSTYTSPTLNVNMYYNVIITCTNSALSFSTTHAVSIVSCTPTGIGKNLDPLGEVSIYPNPNSGEFVIEAKENGTLTLADLVGRIVFSTAYQAGENDVNIKQLPKGIYYARLQSAKTTRLVKILKQ